MAVNVQSVEGAVSALPVVTPEAVTSQVAQSRSEVTLESQWADQFPTMMILGFGVVALIGFYLILRAGFEKTENTRIYVIIVVVIGTLLVVSNSFTEQQTSAVIGFFGTIAGYLLGRSDLQSERTEEEARRNAAAGKGGDSE